MLPFTFASFRNFLTLVNPAAPRVPSLHLSFVWLLTDDGTKASGILAYVVATDEKRPVFGVCRCAPLILLVEVDLLPFFFTDGSLTTSFFILHGRASHVPRASNQPVRSVGFLAIQEPVPLQHWVSTLPEINAPQEKLHFSQNSLH